MPQPNPEALEFLMKRRSRPAKTLAAPVPDPDRLRILLTAGARAPDHGKLEPWRFVVLEKPALERLAGLVRVRGEALGSAPDRIEKAYRQFADADLAVAVVSSPKPSDDIPETEQLLSAGAVCLSLLNAALADGWGANWLTGWPSRDPEFLSEGLGLAPRESIAGFIHIGTETVSPPERPRPDIDAVTSWVRS